MRSIAAALMLGVAACSTERRPESDTTALDSAAAAAPATDSPGESARDTQPAASTNAPARSGAAAKVGATGTKGTSKTAIGADTGMHPTDTFGIHPRDSTLADFLKKRPPEVRRPQDPQKTPR